MGRRLWEVDTARGITLLLMVLFNWSYALRFLDVFSIAARDSWLYWWLFPRYIAFSFIFIAGISLTLSVNRLRRQEPDDWRAIATRKYPARGLRIFALGLGITAVTYALYPRRFIFFGILHLIGAAIFLSRPLLTRPRAALAVGVAALAAAVPLKSVTVSSRLLAAIGFSYRGLSLDYFPLIPWAGVLFLGIWTGHTLYPGGDRRFAVPSPEDLPGVGAAVDAVQFLGRHTLGIYLTHQPALVLLLVLAGYDVLAPAG